MKSKYLLLALNALMMSQVVTVSARIGTVTRGACSYPSRSGCGWCYSNIMDFMCECRGESRACSNVAAAEKNRASVAAAEKNRASVAAAQKSHAK